MPERHRYALADFAVERRDKGWYFRPLLDPPRTYRGPYVSIASVTLMIARQLRREVERRDRNSAGRPNAETGNAAPF